jgi:exopolyphosphatase / guanosine-5'-triphosphate,3'-diphosphate pyrophosphatase
MPQIRAADVHAVRTQLGREPTTTFSVVARCSTAGGHPLVIRNHPLDREGRPFPTLYWLTCPVAVKVIARLESDGWIARLNRRAEEDDGFRQRLERAHAEYARERGQVVEEAGEWGGVGGIRRGLKCLHAHYAHHLVGGNDPVGEWVAEHVEPIHEEGQGRVAAIDLGTNSVRLLVAEPDSRGELVELARDMVITRIGQGVDRNGRITDEALERTVAVVERYGRRARALHAERVRVAATSAVRDATNRGELERAVRRVVGSGLEIITGEQEATLSFQGATRGLDLPSPYLVVDIGGGSTEFVLGEREPEAAVSTQMGSVRLTERFVRGDPPADQELAAIRGAVDEVLDDVEAAVPVHRAKTMIAVAGTATTMQAIALDLPAHDPDVVHRSTITALRAREVLNRLASMTVAERAALAVMPPGREDVIVAGATVLERILARWGFGETVISATDILDGLALRTASEQLT